MTRARKPVGDMTPAAKRELFRTQPHTYRPGQLGLCDKCAAGRVFWVHRDSGKAVA